LRYLEINHQAIIDLLRGEFAKLMSLNREIQYELNAERKEALRSRFSSSDEALK
jgi:hypothetical protein